MRMEDTLDKEKVQYNLSGFHLNHAQKMALQTLYRKQLDEIVQKKQKEKQAEKERAINEKKKYNEIADFNKESEKVKDQAYKNYYNMLLNNQEHYKTNYVNPYSMRDSLKDQHIMVSVEEGQRKEQNKAILEQQRYQEKKNLYKTELRHQLRERQRVNSLERENEIRKKQEYRRFGKSPQEIKQNERLRQLDEMNKYKEDLDKVKEEKYQVKNRPASEQDANLPLQQHHPLINPVPFNIQNPYLRKQMERQSYFARVANQNFSNP